MASSEWRRQSASYQIENAEPTESSPLLPSETVKLSKSDSPTGPEFQDTTTDTKRNSLPLFLHEFWVILAGAVPVILAYALQNSLQTFSVFVVGHSSPENLSTAAFSYMFAACSGWVVGMGGSTALDTLASSSYTGAQNKHDLGVLLQRAFLVLGMIYVPVALLWLFSEPVFLMLGQTERLSRESSKFLTCLIPGGLGYVYFETMKKFLQAQGKMRAGTYVLLVTSPINVALNYLFVYKVGWGYLGSPVATGISYWLSFLGLVIYTKTVAGSECWGGWSKRCLQNLGVFTKLALLGILDVGLPWWAFEIVALTAGRLGELSLASQSVIMTADQLMNTIPFGIGVATSARVGNMLGAKSAKGAARSAQAAITFAVLVGTLILAILMSTRHIFARIVTDDAEVVKLTAKVLPYVALFQIADGLYSSCDGILRAMGRQHVGATVSVIGFYAIALPLGIHLAFHGWALPGLWMGLCVALYLSGFGTLGIVGLSNWDHQIEMAFKRMDNGVGQQGNINETHDTTELHV